MVSRLDFVNEISATCKISTNFFDRTNEQVKKDSNKCVLSNIHFDYDKLNNLEEKILIMCLLTKFNN